MHVKQDKWYTLSRALITSSVWGIGSRQPLHFAENSLTMEQIREHEGKEKIDH
jgi:hypothetical protein